MRDLLIRSHLGLGDALVSNGLVRFKARQSPEQKIIFLSKSINVPSVSFSFRDQSLVTVFGVESDAEAQECIKLAQDSDHEVLALGFFGSPPFDADKWDQEFYRQAGVPFEERWSSFRVDRQPSREIARPPGDYVFVHDDKSRGMEISRRRLPKRLKVIRPDPKKSNNIFDWWTVIENAKEIHVIDSCFLHLVDNLEGLKAARLVRHSYFPRTYPSSKLSKSWTSLK